jgi:hypothetical protein
MRYRGVPVPQRRSLLVLPVGDVSDSLLAKTFPPLSHRWVAAGRAMHKPCALPPCCAAPVHGLGTHRPLAKLGQSMAIGPRVAEPPCHFGRPGSQLVHRAEAGRLALQAEPLG